MPRLRNQPMSRSRPRAASGPVARLRSQPMTRSGAGNQLPLQTVPRREAPLSAPVPVPRVPAQRPAPAPVPAPAELYASAYAQAYTSACSGPAYTEAYALALADHHARHGNARPDVARRAPRRRIAAVLVTVGVLAIVLAALVLPGLLGRETPEQSAAVAGGGTDAGVRTSGSTARARVLPSGDILVEEQIRSRAGLADVTLSAPTVPGLDPGALGARDISVEADSAPASGPRTLSGTPVRFTLRDAHQVQISYVLTGVVQRDSSQAGRALARVVGLHVDYGSTTMPLTVAVQGAAVLSLACTPSGQQAAPTPCGSPGADGWTVRLDRGQANDQVMAQLDLGRG